MSNIGVEVTKTSEMSGLGSDTLKDGNVIISKGGYADLQLYGNSDTMSDSKQATSYIKCIERLIRTSKEYSGYIKYLKEDLDPPLNHCMVYSEITDEVTQIEMHHGPIFTLYDYVEIVLLWAIKNARSISTSYIAYKVMKEHMLHNVQVVMLSEMVHGAAHIGEKKKKATSKFIDYRMAHGDIVSFLKKYYTGLSHKHIGKIDSYMRKFKENESKDDGFFEEFVTKWSDEIMRQ